MSPAECAANAGEYVRMAALLLSGFSIGVSVAMLLGRR